MDILDTMNKKERDRICKNARYLCNAGKISLKEGNKRLCELLNNMLLSTVIEIKK